MKKILSLLLILFVCSISQAQNLQIKVDSLSVSVNKSEKQIENVIQSVDSLSRCVDNLSYLVETQKDIISQEQSAVENSIGALNILLTVVSILAAIGGIFLGRFINSKEKKVEELLKQVETKKNEVEKLEEKTSKIKEETLRLNKEINEDIKGLYDRLKKEETTSLFKRLVDVPEDISNIHQLLYARDIDIENFEYLVTSYQKFKSINIDENKYLYYEGLFLTQFFQHFCGQAISHTLVRDDLIRRFSNCINCAFLNDIKYSTNSLVLSLNKDKTIANKVDILFEYIKAFNETRHKGLRTPYEIIVREYDNDDDLIQVWEKLTLNNIIIKQFGELLCDRFSANNTFVSSVKESVEKLETDDNYELNSK